MSDAFVVERQADGSARPVPFEVELAFAKAEPPLEADGYAQFELNANGGPELVLCAAANAYGPGETASGRRATPFTFSRTAIGGPDVGYVRTSDYLDAMGMTRRKDLTIPAVLAISGASFSPGMGKMSLGSIDHLLAVTNARLGVWVPHPAYVAEWRDAQAALAPQTKKARWRDGPGWPWFMREVVGHFRLRGPYLYVTDGGHWENLGLVEVLRRGCRNVVVISAAGDGANSFSTIGEAIALAREELDLEIDIDLEPMRARFDPPNEPVPPPTLRHGAHRTPKSLARSAYVVGDIFDLRDGGEKYGKIVILEANLTADLPWDVATWAEGHPIFPDDPTSDQNFSHRQFESHRRLGRFQMQSALDDPVVSAFLV